MLIPAVLTWHVAAYRGNAAPWWTKIAGRLTHVSCFGFVAGRGWIFMDAGAGGIDLHIFQGEELNAVLAWIFRRDGRVMAWPARKARERLAPGGLTCVGVVASVIGLRCWWALTPALLLCALRSRGAVDSFSHSRAVVRERIDAEEARRAQEG